MSEEKWHRLPADEIGLLIGKDANATVFPPTESPFAKGRWYYQLSQRPLKKLVVALFAPPQIVTFINRNSRPLIASFRIFGAAAWAPRLEPSFDEDTDVTVDAAAP